MKEESLYKKILIIVPEIKQGVSKGLLISIVFELIKFIPLLIIKEVVDKLVSGQSSTAQVVYFIGGIFLVYLVLIIIDYFAKKAEFRWMVEYETAVLRRAKHKLLELHLGFHESFSTGEQVSKIVKGAQKMSELTWFLFNEFLPTIVQLVLTVFLLFYEQWFLALIFALFLPLVLFITLRSHKQLQPYRRKHHQKYDLAVGELGESLMNISTVKDYVQEKEQYRKFNYILDDYISNANLRGDYQQAKLFWRDLLITLGRALTFGIAAWMVFKGTLSAGSLVLVYTLTERAFLSVFRIGRLYSYLEDAMESINRIAGLLRSEPQVKDLPGAESVRALNGEIEFVEVSFSYGQNLPVLKWIRLKIKPKQVVALVGRSGSGKSTIAKLLLRNYNLSDGKILVDGKNIQNYKIADYKKRIAVVSQNVEIFNRTVLENILFANPQATRQQALAAAKKAYAHDFIKEFPQGYNTLVGEKGIRLSGGQKQRLSIARALLLDPDIFIFDEATSSLDTESEQYIQKSIFSISKKKTTLIIAHRLSTIKHADLIVVMDHGRIVEQGTYQELLKKKGYFAKMIALQTVAEIRE